MSEEDIADALAPVKEDRKLVTGKDLETPADKKEIEFTYDELIEQEDIKMEKEFREEMDLEYKSEKEKLEDESG